MKNTIHLTPPCFSPNQIKEKITCIRAHRERIFRVETELTSNKLICHNYGQGGAGWTFLFGCVHESLRQFEQQLQDAPRFKNKPIVVIGAGCYGLLTAIILARRGYKVRIIAKETDDLPSHKAAGFFFPRARKSSAPQEIATFLARGIESYSTYLEIIRGEHPFIAQGPQLLPAYFSPGIDPGFSPYLEQGLVKKPKLTKITFDAKRRYDVMVYKTLFINAAVMMQELTRNIQELGIVITPAEIRSWDEVDEPIIFNCAGMGAQQLANDPRIVPVQGHLITLQNQAAREQLNYMINVKVVASSPLGMPRDELIYFAPKGEGILGITFLRGQNSLTANHHEFERLIQRSQDFFGTP